MISVSLTERNSPGLLATVLISEVMYVNKCNFYKMHFPVFSSVSLPNSETKRFNVILSYTYLKF